MELKIIPRMSEKSYAQSQNGIYVFNVPATATKQQIATAVAKQFDVAVVTVNVVLAKGKVKQSFRKGGRPVTGKRRDVKKAYVRLAEGNSIPVFAAVEAEEKK
ncbi:MAG TPA: 50S ribosomal protein L23 [Candidatus Saccharimonadales bacterium]|nr:50S ribosomal protein L23 [Candidatus Saccharimonadales bacterium]